MKRKTKVPKYIGGNRLSIIRALRDIQGSADDLGLRQTNTEEKLAEYIRVTDIRLALIEQRLDAHDLLLANHEGRIVALETA